MGTHSYNRDMKTGTLGAGMSRIRFCRGTQIVPCETGTDFFPYRGVPVSRPLREGEGAVNLKASRNARPALPITQAAVYAVEPNS